MTVAGISDFIEPQIATMVPSRPPHRAGRAAAAVVLGTPPPPNHSCLRAALETAKICPILMGTENFRPISRLILGVSGVKTLYSSSETNKSIIVNRQCRGEKFKYVPKFWIGGTRWFTGC